MPLLNPDPQTNARSFSILSTMPDPTVIKQNLFLTTTCVTETKVTVLSLSSSDEQVAVLAGVQLALILFSLSPNRGRVTHTVRG